MTAATTSLRPRKSPRQDRSTATVDALHAATLQVLIDEGLARCTTTRIAERAGTSVGTLYQYYPNRDALIAGVLRRHLDGVASAVEAACALQHGRPCAAMASALVSAFLSVKLGRAAESRALYAVSHERGGAALAARLRERMVIATAQMLSTASDARFPEPTTTASFALAALIGPVHLVLEGRASKPMRAALEPQLVSMVTAYLAAQASRA